MQEQPKMNIDFKNTTSVDGFDGGKLFGQAVLIRKISKFIAGTDSAWIQPGPGNYENMIVRHYATIPGSKIHKD